MSWCGASGVDSTVYRVKKVREPTYQKCCGLKSPLTGVILNFLINKMSASEISNQSCSSKIAAALFYCITSPIFVLVYISVLQSSFFFRFILSDKKPVSIFNVLNNNNNNNNNNKSFINSA